MFSGFKQFLRVFGDNFRETPDAPQLEDADKRALLVGLINGEQITANYNSLTTGLERKHLQKNLEEWYSIVTPQDGVEILEWFANKGHRTILKDILPIIKTVNGLDARKEAVYALYNARFKQALEDVESEEEMESIRDKYGDDFGRAASFVENLEEVIKGEHGRDTFVPFTEELVCNGILAWDMGRFVTITRCVFDLGYIDEQTAWSYIRRALQMTLEEYSTWKEFAAAYIAGRGLWGGDSMTLDGIYGIAKECLNGENSPWKTMPLK